MLGFRVEADVTSRDGPKSAHVHGCWRRRVQGHWPAWSVVSSLRVLRELSVQPIGRKILWAVCRLRRPVGLMRLPVPFAPAGLSPVLFVLPAGDAAQATGRDWSALRRRRLPVRAPPRPAGPNPSPRPGPARSPLAGDGPAGPARRHAHAGSRGPGTTGTAGAMQASEVTRGGSEGPRMLRLLLEANESGPH
jgi:hypothetical protein